MTENPKRLRITLVVGAFPALSETFVLDQVIYLLAREHDVRIVAFEARDEVAVQEEVARYRLLDRTRYLTKPKSALAKLAVIAAAIGAAGGGMIRTVLAMRRARTLDGEVGYLTTLSALVVAFAAQERPDIFLCHFGQNGSLTLRAVEALGWPTPVATIFHGFDLTMLVKQHGPRMYKHLLSRGALFLPVCVYFADLLQKLGAPGDRVIVQRMCVSPRTLDDAIRLLPPRDLPGAFMFISIGRLVEKKGHAVLLAAFLRAFGHLPEREVCLTIIGDGPLRPEIEAAAQNSASVLLLGALPRADILARLGLADVAVQPSIEAADGDMEGLPMVV